MISSLFVFLALFLYGWLLLGLKRNGFSGNFRTCSNMHPSFFVSFFFGGFSNWEVVLSFCLIYFVFVLGGGLLAYCFRRHFNELLRFCFLMQMHSLQLFPSARFLHLIAEG